MNLEMPLQASTRRQRVPLLAAEDLNGGSTSSIEARRVSAFHWGPTIAIAVTPDLLARKNR